MKKYLTIIFNMLFILFLVACNLHKDSLVNTETANSDISSIEINAENIHMFDIDKSIEYKVLLNLKLQKDKSIKISENNNRNIRNLLLIKKENLEDFKAAVSIENDYFENLNFIADDIRVDDYINYVIFNDNSRKSKQKRNEDNLIRITSRNTDNYRWFVMPFFYYIKKEKNLNDNEEKIEQHQETYRILRSELKRVAEWMKNNNI